MFISSPQAAYTAPFTLFSHANWLQRQQVRLRSCLCHSGALHLAARERNESLIVERFGCVESHESLFTTVPDAPLRALHGAREAWDSFSDDQLVVRGILALWGSTHGRGNFFKSRIIVRGCVCVFVRSVCRPSLSVEDRLMSYFPLEDHMLNFSVSFLCFLKIAF